jgi:hypothetical protein
MRTITPPGRDPPASGAKDHPEVKAKPDDVKTLVKFVLAQ